MREQYNVTQYCNNVQAYLLCHANGQMHVYLIALSIKIITKHNVFAVYQFKPVKMVPCYIVMQLKNCNQPFSCAKGLVLYH